MKKTVNDFSNTKGIEKDSQLLFKIYHSVSRILLQKQDYQSLERYLQYTFNDFSKKRLFNKNNHDTKLQMLTYLVNSLFKNNKLGESLRYAEKLRVAMEEYNKLHYDKYLFYYYNSLVINYSKKDLEKAISILNEAKENPIIKKLPSYIVFVYLNLTTLNFDKKDYKLSLKNLIKLYMHESFKNLDEVFRYKITIAELIIRYELKDFDFIEHKNKQIKKEFTSLLNNQNYQRPKKLMDILLLMIKSTNIRVNKNLMVKINELIHSSDREAIEGDLINYNDWLKSKI